MKLLVRNLCRDTTESDIRAMFEKFGAVQSCTLVMDPKTGLSKGFGFIEMPKSGEAKIAMKALNGTQVAGAIMRVKKVSLKKNQETMEEMETSERKAGSRDKLHGVTLEMIVTQLVDEYGWNELGKRINISCFTTDPGMTSSLKFLRKTTWAREKVEVLYQRLITTKQNTRKPETASKHSAEPAHKPEVKHNSEPDNTDKTELRSNTEEVPKDTPEKAIKKNPWGTVIDDDE